MNREGQIAEMLRLRGEGLSYQAIADRLFWSRSSVRVICTARLGKTLSGHWSRNDRADAMRKAGASFEQIADALGYAGAINAADAVYKMRKRMRKAS